MGGSESKPRKVTVENTPIFISDDLRDRLNASAVSNAALSQRGGGGDTDLRPSDAERSPDDFRVGSGSGTESSTRSLDALPDKAILSSYIPSPEDRMTLGEETALALLRMREERDRELTRMQSEYFQKIRKAEEDFANINKIKEDVYAKAVEETAALFQKPRMAACGDVEKAVLECYRANPTETLACHSLVNQFHECVASTRVREALTSGGGGGAKGKVAVARSG